MAIHSCIERVFFDSPGPTHSIALVWACRMRGQSPRSHGRQSCCRVQGARQRDHSNLIVVVWTCRWSSPSVSGTLRYTQEQASALQPKNSGQQTQASASASWVVRFLASCRRSTTVAADMGCRPCAVAAAVKYNINVVAASNKKWTVCELAVQNYLMDPWFSTS